MNSARKTGFKYASQGLIAVALTGVVLHLPGCGGGGTSVGAPLNPAPGPAAPAPLAVNPANLTLYVNQPTSLLVTGGVPPYRAFSSNPALLPVLQDVIGSVVPLAASGAANAAGNTTSMNVTITDAVGNSTNSAVSVIPSPFLVGANAFTIQGANCSSAENAMCAGQTAVAILRLVGATGAPIAGRQVRFESLQGQYNFVLDDAAAQLSKTITVTTDAQGQAIVRLRADNNALTSFALIRATDLASGARLDKSFAINQVTNGDTVLTVSPQSWTIKGSYKGVCSSGVESGYYIFGGSPPYRVVSSAPDAVAVGSQFGGAFGSTTSVVTNGGYFVARTFGGCINNSNSIIFITDSTGRTVGAGLENVEGDTPLPTAPPPAAFAISPPNALYGAIQGPGDPAPPAVCPAQTYSAPFLIQGGSGRYRATSTGVITNGGVAVPGFPGNYTISGGSFTLTATTTGPTPKGSVIAQATVTDDVASPITVTLTCN